MFSRWLDRVAELMEARLRVMETTLCKLQRGRKLLPRRVQGAAQSLAEASEQAKKCRKLLVQIDPERTAGGL